MPALLRRARAAYATAVADALLAAGFDDVPRNGAFVLSGSARNGMSPAAVAQGLGVSKQAASQLIDTLVLGG